MVEAATRRRLQEALAGLSRASRARGDSRGRRAVTPAAGPRTPKAPEPVAGFPGPVLQPAAPPADLGSVEAKLDRIERTLAEMRAPKSPTGEIFKSWVQQGYWSHIRFGDYLRLQRTGLL